MLKPSLQLRVAQQLTMTPQLQQAIRLLQLPILELNTELREMLESNVMLELDEPAAQETDFAAADERPEPMPRGTDEAVNPAGEDADFDFDPDESGVLADEPVDSALWEGVSSQGNNDPWSVDDSHRELADESGQSLREHLLWQLEMEHFTPREAVIGEALVDYVNDDGYLSESTAGILAMLPAAAGFSLAEVEACLAKVQALDPPGVAARDLAECLQLQLRQLATDTPGLALALAIAGAHLELVAAQDYPRLRRVLGATDAELEAALALIRSCHPRPGAGIEVPQNEYVVPDVFVRRVGGRWLVETNRSLAPRLKVNQAYAEMLHGDGSSHPELRSQLQEARWLVRSLEIRDDTLLKVARCIVERQAGFLDHGEEQMKPMILKDVAEAVEMHESTISRVTSGKYMHTPRGIFELRYFFSSQLSGEDGSEQSSTAIRARIRRMIGQEDPQAPLSDSHIAELLQADGINIARRTVAKYRESLKIASSSRRRQRPTGKESSKPCA
ncbi:MAG: RNA polymerase factor sigma-54 [Gammaproteobacteria bacterium]|nr:RNA polymerase factor sigma-54 [Gammaproteobacteria bacterium]